MALFSDAWMDTLLSKNDIVSVVSSYVSLQAKGKNMWGLCPFHHEKTPSFSVAPEKQMFYCFGCHTGGGVVQFIMQIERLTYVEAVRFLAQRVGMELPSNTNDAKLQKERAKKQRLYAACREAALFYHKQLLGPAGKEAQRYLLQRGIQAQIVKKFGLGYAPDSWDMLKHHMMGCGYTEQELLDSGLLVKNNNSQKVYDAYRNRVIFPIIGTNNQVLGFGARTLGQDKPKYINTGNTPIYNKRNNLYALNMQKKTKSSDLIIVEGYLDVISLYQAGIDHAVASLGTALTQQQARLLKRYVSSVYIAYDGDAAGQNAMLRGLDILAKEGLTVRVIQIPDRLDPDDFVRKYGKDAFLELKATSLSLNMFKLERLSLQFDLTTEDGREAFAMAGCQWISGLQPVEQERYYTILSRKTGIPVETLIQQGALTKVEKHSAQVNNIVDIRHKQTEESDLSERILSEKALLQAMVASPEAALQAMEQDGLELFSKPSYRYVATCILTAIAQEKSVDITAIVNSMDGEDAAEVADILLKDIQSEDLEKTVQDCMNRIKRTDLLDKIREYQAQATNPSIALEEKLILVEKIQQLHEEVRKLV